MALCPTSEQLDALVHGTLSEFESGQLVSHLDCCRECQSALQQSATGAIPVESLVAGIYRYRPPKDSSYWPTVERLQRELKQEVDEGPESLHAAVDRIAETSGPENHGRSAGSRRELDFLDPSDDPAYLGKLHHFQIAKVIGRGGMGIVLEAFDTHLQRNVAIKVLNPELQSNEIARQRFCREGRAAAAISHEHVVSMYQVAKAHEGEVAYLVMQLIEGDTLEQRLASGKPLSPIEVVRIAMQAAAGLAAAHRREMVHRDIKPANIMLEAETNRVKLTDFGLARTTDDVKLTKSGMVTGTPLYMSPEQTLGETADERSDLFSLGVVMYEMATGVAPFQAPSAIGVMQNIIKLQPMAPHRLNPSIERPLSDLIMSLLEKEPNDRPESASAVANVLATILGEYGAISPLNIPTSAATEVKKLSGNYRRSERRWVIAAWVAAFVGLSLAVTSYFAMRPDVGDNFPSIVLAGNPGTIWSVDFSTDGKQLAAAVEDGSVRIWDTEKQVLVKSFHAHRGNVWTVAYHPSRPWVISSGDDSAIRIWDSSDFKLIREWRTAGAVRSIAIAPDGNRLAAGDRDGTIGIYNIDNGQRLSSHTLDSSISGVDFSADGKLVATVGSDKIVRVFDAETLTARQTLSGHDGPVYAVKFAPIGPLLASVGWNKNVRVWDIETGSQVRNIIGSEGDVWGVSFCSDASHLITGEQMGAARVWDLATGSSVVTLRGHSSAVHNVSLDPSAHRIATGSRDGTIRIWDMNGLARE